MLDAKTAQKLTNRCEQLCRGIACVLFLLFWRQTSIGQGSPENRARLVTVTDAIRMTRLGTEDEGLDAHFSPDGSRLFVVLKRGDLEHDTNVYSLFVFEVALAFRLSTSEPLLTLQSASNQEAIKKPKWLDDNATISFIGENGEDVPQVYAFNIKRKRLEKMTDHATAVRDYDISGSGQVLLFEADRPPREATDGDDIQRHGVVITSQTLIDLLTGDCGHRFDSWGKQLFVQVEGRGVRRVVTDDQVVEGVLLSVSPDGYHAIFGAFVRGDLPAAWSEYKDDLLRPYVAAKRRSGEASHVAEYFILDTRRNTVEPLLGTPWSFRGNDALAWAPDGASVVVSGARLPLDARDAVEQDVRKNQTYVVEVKLQDRSFEKITSKSLHVLSWNPQTNKLLLRAGWRKGLPLVAFEKSGSVWKESNGAPEVVARPVNVSLEEDMNNPPKLFISDPKTKKKKLLFDLNPQFGELRFGKEEAVNWKATDGHDVSGGLYLPPDYMAGHRYPLMIQTHGFSPDKFWIDGPWSSAFAAQPLAAKGFVVLQVGHSVDPWEDEKFLDTPQEAERQMAAYEGAVDYLDRRGLVDRKAVGIIGFSRTVYYTAFTLTHSKYDFAAATLADGIDGGYFLYRAFPDLAPDFDSINGGPPVGETIPSWLRRSPSFNLDKVNAPVRIEAYGPEGPFIGWDWFAGLSTLGKPVDFIYLPKAPHMLVKPSERLVSQQGNVDWFRFWLKGEEDPDPAKAEQYARWRELRKLQQQNEKKSANAASPTPN